MNPLLQSQFMRVALPIMVTLVATVWISSWSQNKRFDDLRDDMNRRFDEVNARLERIERKLDNHEERMVRVEERTSPVARRLS
jgi:23S rRNA C2498 (ribose-2'-O)-methylase RlmM